MTENYPLTEPEPGFADTHKPVPGRHCLHRSSSWALPHSTLLGDGTGEPKNARWNRKEITSTFDSWSLSRCKWWNQIVYLFLAHIPQYEIQLNYLMSLTVIIATYQIQRKRRHAVTMEEREKLTEIRFKSLSLSGNSESYIPYVFLLEIKQEENS